MVSERVLGKLGLNEKKFCGSPEDCFVLDNYYQKCYQIYTQKSRKNEQKKKILKKMSSMGVCLCYTVSDLARRRVPMTHIKTPIRTMGLI